MTELGELVAINAADEKANDKCPFCYKKSHAFPSRKTAASAAVTSKPNQLACTMLVVQGAWSHTTAKHHLISAIQCYKRVRRLVRMASMVKYDVNDPPNGIGLPTVANNITYTVGNVGPQKFGRFTDLDKRTISFAVMEQAGAQWHVGHHAFTIEIPDDWADEQDTNAHGHEVSYDESVIKELLKILDAWVEAKVCEEEDDKSSSLKKDLDQVSKLIHDKLDEFGTAAPWQSEPFFVSRLAFDYAADKRQQSKRKRDDDDDPPPTKPTKRAKMTAKTTAKPAAKPNSKA